VACKWRCAPFVMLILNKMWFFVQLCSSWQDFTDLRARAVPLRQLSYLLRIWRLLACSILFRFQIIRDILCDWLFPVCWWSIFTVSVRLHIFKV